MKKLSYLVALGVVLLSLQSCMVSQKPKMAFFNQARHQHPDAKFTSINVPMFLARPMIKKALREDGESDDMLQLFRKISAIKIMTVENGNEKMTADYGKYLNRNNFEEWMTVRKEKEIINFQAKQKGEQIRKLLITIASGTDLVYVDISGRFTADDISRLINYSEKNDVKKMVSE